MFHVKHSDSAVVLLPQDESGQTYTLAVARCQRIKPLLDPLEAERDEPVFGVLDLLLGAGALRSEEKPAAPQERGRQRGNLFQRGHASNDDSLEGRDIPPALAEQLLDGRRDGCALKAERPYGVAQEVLLARPRLEERDAGRRPQDLDDEARKSS